jgi:hypothetical protein
MSPSDLVQWMNMKELYLRSQPNFFELEDVGGSYNVTSLNPVQVRNLIKHMMEGW